MDPTLSAAEYRLLIENSPVMIWRSGLDAKCDYFNETWLEFTGRTMAQEAGDGWAEGVHPDDFDRCVAQYLDHFDRREPFEMEYRLRRNDGSWRWILDRGVPYMDDIGTFAGFIGSCVDVDERRKAQEAQRKHDEDQLALARDFEKWILAIVSHDIRNPLSNIQLAADVVKLTSDASSPARRQVEVIARSVKRIQHIVGDLLDLSREREGAGIRVNRQPSDLRVVCQQIVDDLQEIAKERRVTFECTADGQGVWDAQRVLQAVSNLTSNAIEHGAAGTPVQVRLTGTSATVTVEVENEGTIPADLLPRIFEPFRSGRHRGSRGDGLGLGLFIANAIAKAHGGALEVDSSSQRTKFRLLLPRTIADEEKG